MDEIVDYTKQIVDIAVSFQYEDLYPDEEPLGNCPLLQPAGVRALVVLPLPRGAGRRAEDDDCRFRIWKDKSGRYMDRQTVRILLDKGETEELEGFAARDGRTYNARLTLEDGERRDPRRRRQRGRARDRGGRVRGRRRAARPLPDGLRHAGRRDADPLPVSGGNREDGRERREGARVRGVAAEGAEEAQALQGAGRGQALSVPAAAHRVQARDHARRGAPVHRPEQEDGAPDRLHLALRPPVLGDAVPEGERPPRLRVPAAPEEGRAGRARGRRRGAGRCDGATARKDRKAPQESSAPRQAQGQGRAEGARAAARARRRPPEQPETRKAARRKT